MKKYLVVIMIMTFALHTQAQDVHFSQFYENSIMRNPALTGIFSGDYKVGANYRTQWNNISVPFRTFMLTGETRIATNKEVGDYLSIGVSGIYDQAGTTSFNTMQAYTALNYNKSLQDTRNTYLSVGFAGGYIQRTINFAKATYSSQYVNGGYSVDNPSGENFNKTNIENFDIAAGISLNSSAGPDNIVNYYVGFSVFHLNRPKHSFDVNDVTTVLPAKYAVNAGISWRLTPEFGFSAHADYAMQATSRQIIAGGLLSWQTLSTTDNNVKLYAGVFVRYKDAFIPTFKIDYATYSFTFSYDANTSSLKPASAGAGAYEVSLFVKGKYRRQGYGSNTNCPRFEHMLQGNINSY